eukprot:jgi/Tetstr1/464128/TSEL_008933.t1
MFGSYVLSAVASVLWRRDEEVMRFHADLASRRRRVTSEELRSAVAEAEGGLKASLEELRRENADLRAKVDGFEARLRGSSLPGLCSLDEARAAPLFPGVAVASATVATPGYSEPRNGQMRCLPTLTTVDEQATPFCRSSRVPPPDLGDADAQVSRIRKTLENLDASARPSNNGGVGFTDAGRSIFGLEFSGCELGTVNDRHTPPPPPPEVAGEADADADADADAEIVEYDEAGDDDGDDDGDDADADAEIVGEDEADGDDADADAEIVGEDEAGDDDEADGEIVGEDEAGDDDEADADADDAEIVGEDESDEADDADDAEIVGEDEAADDDEGSGRGDPRWWRAWKPL